MAIMKSRTKQILSIFSATNFLVSSLFYTPLINDQCISARMFRDFKIKPTFIFLKVLLN